MGRESPIYGFFSLGVVGSWSAGLESSIFSCLLRRVGVWIENCGGSCRSGSGFSVCCPCCWRRHNNRFRRVPEVLIWLRGYFLLVEVFSVCARDAGKNLSFVLFVVVLIIDNRRWRVALPRLVNWLAMVSVGVVEVGSWSLSFPAMG